MGLSSVAHGNCAFYFSLCRSLARDWRRFSAYSSRLQFFQPAIHYRLYSVKAGWSKIKRFAHRAKQNSRSRVSKYDDGDAVKHDE